MKERSLVMVSMLILSLQSVCLAQSLSPASSLVPSTSKPCSESSQVAVMFYQGKSQQEILDAWRCYVKQNPKIDVAAALSSLQQQVRQIGEDKVQRSSMRGYSLNKNSESAVGNEYQQAVQTLANIQRQMHDDAMTILNNLKN